MNSFLSFAEAFCRAPCGCGAFGVSARPHTGLSRGFGCKKQKIFLHRPAVKGRHASPSKAQFFQRKNLEKKTYRSKNPAANGLPRTPNGGLRLSSPRIRISRQFCSGFFQIVRIFSHISLRPSRALLSVISSTYSRFPPMGMPCAMRVTFTPMGLSRREI